MNPQFQSEGRRVGWLLTEIERQAEDRLSPETREQLLEEVSSHLDAAIRARLEIGMEPEEAEREAINEFGPPASYVEKLLTIHEQAEARAKPWLLKSKLNWPTVVSFGAACAYMLVRVLSGGMWNYEFWPNLTGYVCLACFFFFSYRARRIQLMSAALASCGVYIAAMLVMTATTLNPLDRGYWHSGGARMDTLAETNHLLIWDTKALKQLEPVLNKVSRGVSLHAHSMTPVEISKLTPEDRNLLYSKPVIYPPKATLILATADDEGTPTVTYEPTRDLASANSAWRTIGQRASSGLIGAKNFVESDLVTRERAQATPYLIVLTANIIFYCPLLLFMLCTGTLLNALSLGIGWLLNTPDIKRWRRRLA